MYVNKKSIIDNNTNISEDKKWSICSDIGTNEKYINTWEPIILDIEKSTDASILEFLKIGTPITSISYNIF